MTSITLRTLGDMRRELDTYTDEQIRAGVIKPLPPVTFSDIPIPPPTIIPHKRRHLWFVDLWYKRGTPVTRQLHRLTTQRLTRVLRAERKTVKDWNPTRKMGEVEQ